MSEENVMSADHPAGSYEAVARTVNGAHNIYAHYVGNPAAHRAGQSS